jgi:hypothetical protein
VHETSTAAEAAPRPAAVARPAHARAEPPRWANRARLGGAVFSAAVPIGLYLAVRALGILMLGIFGRHAGVSVPEVLGHHFDSVWYTQIADHGYDTTLHTKPDGTLAPSNLAFFPLFPALIVAVKTVTFLPTAVAGVLVSWVAGLVAAWGIAELGNHLVDRRTGLVMVALWAALPAAIVESMAYTETIFTAAVAWALLAVLKRQWLIAAGVTALGGLSRPSTTPLIAAVCLAALVAIIKRRDGWRPWVALVGAPAGFVAYNIWVSAVLGRLDGYVYVQRDAWHLGFDFGASTAKTFWGTLNRGEPLSYVVSAATIAVAVMLLVLAFLDRQPWPLLVFSAAMIVTTLGTSQYFWAKGRYLIPAVTLLLPAAIGLARARGRTMVVVLTFLALSSAWYGTYLSFAWMHSP